MRCAKFGRIHEVFIIWLIVGSGNPRHLANSFTYSNIEVTIVDGNGACFALGAVYYATVFRYYFNSRYN